MRVAPAVELSPEERSRLERWQDGEGRSPLRAQRARVVLLAARGMQDLQIAHRLGLHRRTVARWRGRFLAARLRGLEDRPAAMRRGRIPEEVWQAIVRSSIGSPPGHLLPSTRRLAQRFGVSHMTVRRVWEAYALQPPARVALPARPDPERPWVPWDVIGLFLQPPLAALAVTLRPAVDSARDPRRAPPALPGPQQGLPLRLGAPATRVASAFRPLAGRETHLRESGAESATLMRFLEECTRRTGPTSGIAVLLVTPSSGLPPALDRWSIRHPQLTVGALPDLPAWRLRAIELLRECGRQPGRAAQFRGMAELHRSLAQSIATYGERSGPYRWVASARELAGGEAAYRLRYELAVTAHAGFKSPASLTAIVGSTVPADQSRQMARAVLRGYLRVRAKERVTIESWTGTLEHANALVLESLRLGARPLVLYQDEPTYWAASAEVPARNLASLGEHRKAALERTDVFVSFFGPSDRERFHSLPAGTLFKLSEFQDALYEAAAKGGARAVQMAIGRVSAGSARMYGVAEEPWREELIGGTLVDPLALQRLGRAVAHRLGRAGELTIEHPNGTHLALRLAGRTPVVTDGQMSRAQAKGSWNLVTLPAGVVTVAIDESVAEGVFRSNHPSSIGLCDTVGELVDGRWEFAGGRLCSYRFATGQEFFAQSYGRAPPGRDRPASVSFGLNPRLLSAPLLEDQGLGTVTLNIGRNDHVGGRTKAPWWAWLFLRGATVRVDGQPLVLRGRYSR
ncbi:MAG: helix-turn-helix domain-containing protein [Thermoplasmata archaeon]|nr:helix-turn-helix domain-containing protein [Thermoplasmata archaeon]